MNAEDPENDVIHVALAANHDYCCGMEATLASMLLFAGGKDRIQFHLLDDGLSVEDRERLVRLAERMGGTRPLHFLKPDLSAFNRSADWCGSHTAYARLLLCDLLPTLDWIVYADVDTLWFADICEFWDLRDDSVSIVWSRDTETTVSCIRGVYAEWGVPLDEKRYCCSGVVMMNLAKMRRERFVERCFGFIAAHPKLPFPDQDALNVLLMHDSMIAENRWDAMNPSREALRGAVIHCNGVGRLWKRNERRPRRPSWYIWYRFYANVVRRRPDEYIPCRRDRLLYALMAFYPGWSVRAVSMRIFGLVRTDQLARTMFFSWLIRRAPWWKRILAYR